MGFIKKIMKLMQNSFPQFRKIEVELTKEQEIEKIPEGPSEYCLWQGVRVASHEMLNMRW